MDNNEKDFKDRMADLEALKARILYNTENEKYYDGLNKKNVEDDKLEKKPDKYDWKPNWVRLEMPGKTIVEKIDGRAVMDKVPNGYVDIPENLIDEVMNGLIDPLNYTRQQLEQLAIAKHNGELTTNDSKNSDLSENEEQNNYNKHKL